MRKSLPRGPLRVIGAPLPLPSVDAMRKHWFRRTRTSYGGMPVTWQGWLCVTVLAVLAVAAAALLPWAASVPVAGLVLLAFLVVSVAKGPIHTRWHWAGQDD